MPRAPRIEYGGAFYHVMCRGDWREDIFRNDGDRRMFLATLGEACERAGFVVHSYVLMNNHYHLLLETPCGKLVDGMRWFQSTYTARFNARHGECGHLFQGRYKAVVVDGKEGEYGRVVGDYIHLNPARAGWINEEKSRLRDYRWSSFPGICGRVKPAKWLRVESVLSWHHWNAKRWEDRREYEKYLERRTQECLEEREEEGGNLRNCEEGGISEEKAFEKNSRNWRSESCGESSGNRMKERDCGGGTRRKQKECCKQGCGGWG